MYLDRNWQIPETEEVGTVITRVRGSDGEGGSLEYGLEPLQFYGTNKKSERLPFRIDPNTGVVYLNESLVGKVRIILFIHYFYLNLHFIPALARVKEQFSCQRSICFCKFTLMTMYTEVHSRLLPIENKVLLIHIEKVIFICQLLQFWPCCQMSNNCQNSS